jgi:hypothetical protein
MGERDRLWGEDDDYVLELVARALHTAQPSPAQVAAAGRAVFTWRTVEAELAGFPGTAPAERRPSTRLGLPG